MPRPACLVAVLAVLAAQHLSAADQEHFPRIYDDLGKPAVVSAAIELAVKGQLTIVAGGLPGEAIRALARVAVAFANDAAVAANAALQVQNAGYPAVFTFVEAIGAPCYALLHLPLTGNGSQGSGHAACSSFFGMPINPDAPSTIASECPHLVADLSLPQYVATAATPPITAFATAAGARAAATRLQSVCGTSQLSVTAAAGFADAGSGRGGTGPREYGAHHHDGSAAAPKRGEYRSLLDPEPGNSVSMVLGACVSIVAHSDSLTADNVTAAVAAALQPARSSAASFAAVLPNVVSAVDSINMNAAAAAGAGAGGSLTIAVPDARAPGGSLGSLADVGGSLGFAESPADGSPWAPVVLQQAYSKQPAASRQPAFASSDGGAALSPAALIGAVAAAVIGTAAVGAVSWRALVLARQRSQARGRRGSSSSTGSATAESAMLPVRAEGPVPTPSTASSARISRSLSSGSNASSGSSTSCGGGPLSARRATGAASFLAADNAALTARGLLLGVSGGSAESEASSFAHKRVDGDPTGDAVHG